MNITLPCVSLLLHDSVVSFIAGILIFWWFCNIRVHSLSIAFGRILCFELRTTSFGWNGRIKADNDEISIKTNSQDKVSLNYSKSKSSLPCQIAVRVLDFVLHMRHNNALGAQLPPRKHRLLCDLNIFSKLETFRFQEESSYIVIPKLAHLTLWQA